MKRSILLYVSDLEKGGAQRVIANLGNYLSGLGHKITILTTNESHISYQLNENISVIQLGYDNFSERRLPKLERVSSVVKFLYTLKNTINGINPEVILTFLTFEINCILSIRKYLESKVIISVRNDPNEIYKTLYQKVRANALFKLADGIVFQTEGAQSFFANKVINKSTIIMNPINEEFLQPRYKGCRKKKIVAVGKFTEQKNHLLLIRAFARIKNQIPEYDLVIYGDGILRNKYIEEINTLDIRDRVMFPGIVDNIRDEIFDASLFVLPSNYEGVSNALLEALSLGLPVVSTDCPPGGSREIINDGSNGLLVPVGDVNNMAKSILKVIKNPIFAEKLSQNASLIQTQFHPEIINELWVDYFDEILKNGK